MLLKTDIIIFFLKTTSFDFNCCKGTAVRILKKIILFLNNLQKNIDPNSKSTQLEFFCLLPTKELYKYFFSYKKAQEAGQETWQNGITTTVKWEISALVTSMQSQLTPTCSGCHHHLVRLHSNARCLESLQPGTWIPGTACAVSLAFLLWSYLTRTHSCFSWTVLIQDHLLQHLFTWHKSITFWSRLPPPPGPFFQPASPALCISETVPNQLLSSLLSMGVWPCCDHPSVFSLHPRFTTAHLLNSSCHSIPMLF